MVARETERKRETQTNTTSKMLKMARLVIIA